MAAAEQSETAEPLPAFFARPAVNIPAVSMAPLLERQRMEIVPRFEAPQPVVRSFSEEVVNDRYAVLDVRSPRFSRTFEDAAVPESWRQIRQSAAAAPPQPPAPPVTSQFEENDIPVNAVETRRSDLEPQDMDLLLGENEAEAVDDRLESDILETCREVQTSISDWHDVGGNTQNTIDPAHGTIEDAEALAVPLIEPEYDVIEPETARNVADDNGIPDASLSESRSPARYVPKPKYRHVFSKLRRRLDNGLRGNK